MYTSYFNLVLLPFENSPHPTFFFDAWQYKKARSLVIDSIATGRGLVVITGPIGTGKTTLIHKVTTDLSDMIKLIWLVEPPSSGDELVSYIAQELNIDPTHQSRLFLIRAIRSSLVDLQARNKKCLLVIDESHLMTAEVLEGIRILLNLEDQSKKFLQVMLAGQQELMDTLDLPKMEPIRQRISTLINLGQMNMEKTCEYILHRLEIAGGDQQLFVPDSLYLVALAARGIPRLINSLCHNALVTAFDSGEKSVLPEHVHSAADLLGLSNAETFHFMAKLSLQNRIGFTSPSDMEEEKHEHDSQKHTFPSFTPNSSPIIDVQEKEIITPWGKTISSSKSQYFLPLLILLVSLLSLMASLWYYGVKVGY